MQQVENKKEFGIFNSLIIVLSIYVLIELMLDTFTRLPIEISKEMEIIDTGICFIFLIDFIIEFYHAESKLKFLKWGWIDLVSCIPTIGILRVGRLFRLVKLLRILRAFRSTKILVKYIFRSKIKGTMTAVSIITVLIIIFSSISILMVETTPESNIKTADDAMWWTFETITTVGYGDKYPVTGEGRLIGVVVMVSGVGLFGTYTAYIASLFLDVAKKEEEEKKKEE
jgi:voltage-gated potassium channel